MSRNHKRILYADLLSPEGHIKFNNIYLNALDGEYDIICVGQGEYTSKLCLPSSCLKTYSFPEFHIPKDNNRWTSIQFRLHQIRMQKYCVQLAIREHCDAIIFSSFENVSLSFIATRGVNIIAICHNNVEQLFLSKIKHHLLRLLSNRIKLVTLTKGAADHLTHNGIKNTLLPHGFVNEVKQATGSNQFIFIPANEAYDDKILRYILSNEYTSFLQNNKCQLVIKQKIADRFNGCSELIKVVSNVLPHAEYETYFSQAAVIILPYAETYTLRSSGIVMEAIANDKFVIVPNTISFSSLKIEGDNGILLYDTAEDIKQLTLYAIRNQNSISFSNIKALNSASRILEGINQLVSIA